MTQPPAASAFQITRHAADPRADGGHRLVHVDATRVTIERVMQGVRMKVGVPLAAYRGLVLAVRQPGQATLTLRHEDVELDVPLGTGDAIELARKARAWSAVLGRAVEVEEACITIGTPRPRRGRPTMRRRAAGDAARLEVSFAGEREIIART